MTVTAHNFIIHSHHVYEWVITTAITTAVQSTHRAAAALWLCPSPKLIFLILQKEKSWNCLSDKLRRFGWWLLWWARKVGVLMKIITTPRTTKKRVKIPAGIEEPFFISFFSFKMNKTLNMQECHDYQEERELKNKMKN